MSESKKTIQMLDLQEQYQSIKPEIDENVMRVLESCYFINGPDVKALEQELAAYCETQFAIGCNSGTDALQIALMAYGIGPGNEVITTPFTFVATAEVIRLLGAKSVFVDIDPGTYCMDPTQIESVITRKTKAIIPVHLYGQSADMNAINSIASKHNLPVIEDACQAIGATYNHKKTCSIGNVGCLSFFPSKNLGAYGDGGMLLTSDKELEETLRMICNHGSKIRYEHQVLGVNSRLDSLQAAILRVRLKYLDQWSEARRKNAALYTELLSKTNVIPPKTAEGNVHVYHQYSIQTKDRDGLRKHLTGSGIASAVHYPIPLHLQPAFRDESYPEGSLPVSEALAQNVMSLPMYPELSEENIYYITDKIMEFVK